MKKTLAVIFLFLFQGIILAQDNAYAREMLDKLASEKFYGRGYVKNGDGKASDFIAKQFKKDKLEKFGEDYFQTYHFPMNTFPKKVEVSIDGKKLVPGEEFVISSSSPSIEGEFPISYVSLKIRNEDSLKMVMDSMNTGQLFLFQNENFKKLYGTTLPDVTASAMLSEKTPYWHVSNGGKVDSTVWLKILKSAIPADAKRISIKAENKYIPEYETQNVVGFVKGKKYPDQFIVLSAHYDHLGMMGETMYPGANDNGSGTAMLLGLAKYYSLPENQPERSIAFIAFSGEEAGLKGSTYFAEHPLLPLEKIQNLVNLDMVGSGSEGITVVNGELFPDVVEAFETINAEENYLPAIKIRGESCNSDHCPFYQKGVKSVFIYTMGPEHMAYHTPEDKSDNFPFTAYGGLFNLLTNYIQQFN
jgi:aminopeptidase YwaD